MPTFESLMPLTSEEESWMREKATPMVQRLFATLDAERAAHEYMHTRLTQAVDDLRQKLNAVTAIVEARIAESLDDVGYIAAAAFVKSGDWR